MLGMVQKTAIFGITSFRNSQLLTHWLENVRKLVTQESIANRCGGISPGAVSQWFNHKSNPDGQNLLTTLTLSSDHWEKAKPDLLECDALQATVTHVKRQVLGEVSDHNEPISTIAWIFLFGTYQIATLDVREIFESHLPALRSRYPKCDAEWLLRVCEVWGRAFRFTIASIGGPSPMTERKDRRLIDPPE